MKVIFLSYYGVTESLLDMTTSFAIFRRLKKITKKTDAKVVLFIKNKYIREQISAILKSNDIKVIIDRYAAYIDINVDIQEFLNHHPEIKSMVIINTDAFVDLSFMKYLVKTDSGRHNQLNNIGFWEQNLSRSKIRQVIQILNIPYKNPMTKQIKNNLRQRF